MDLTCPPCGKRFAQEVETCDRCGCDLSRLLALRNYARRLLVEAKNHETAGALTAARDCYETAVWFWPGVQEADEQFAGVDELPLLPPSEKQTRLPCTDIIARPSAKEIPEQSGKISTVSIPQPRTTDGQVDPGGRHGWIERLLWVLAAAFLALAILLHMPSRNVNDAAKTAAFNQNSIQEDLLLKGQAAETQQEEVSDEKQDTSFEFITYQAIQDSSRALRTGSVSIMATNPQRFVEVLQHPLSPSEREVINRARIWAAVRLYEGSANEDPASRRQKLEASIALWPTGYQVDDAYFAIAKMEETTDPAQAIMTYKKVLAIPAGIWFHDDALYAIGILRARLGDKEGSVEAFNRLHREFPGSEGDRLARLALKHF